MSATLFRRWLTGTVAAGLALLMAAPAAQGAVAPCRVRNVTQDTHGRSLIRMAEKARDGDLLRVRGTCHGEVIIGADIAIRGRGAAVLTGRGRTRVVRVRSGVTVTLADLIIQRGHGDIGAGIRNDGTLRILRSFVQYNRSGFAGGGIANSGRLRILDSVIRRNHEEIDGGGGIASKGSSLLVLRRTRVLANTSTLGLGGGIATDSPTLIVGSVIRGNRADGGGGIWDDTEVTLIDSRILGNVAQTSGGGVLHVGGTLTLTSSSVTDNTAGIGGGGIYASGGFTVTLDATSSVTDNFPDDCVGTPAC